MNLTNNIKKYEENIQIERELWNEYISKGLIRLAYKCPKCKKNITLKEYNSSINPYVGRCNNIKCRKIEYLRKHTIFELNSKTHLSLIRYRVELSLFHFKNENHIYDLIINENIHIIFLKITF